MEPQQFGEQLFTAYESGYEDPRPLHYSDIQDKWNTDELGETDAIADAFDLGCRHTENGVTKYTKEELLDEMASW